MSNSDKIGFSRLVVSIAALGIGVIELLILVNAIPFEAKGRSQLGLVALPWIGFTLVVIGLVLTAMLALGKRKERSHPLFWVLLTVLLVIFLAIGVLVPGRLKVSPELSLRNGIAFIRRSNDGKLLGESLSLRELDEGGERLIFTATLSSPTAKDTEAGKAEVALQLGVAPNQTVRILTGILNEDTAGSVIGVSVEVYDKENLVGTAYNSPIRVASGNMTELLVEVPEAIDPQRSSTTFVLRFELLELPLGSSQNVLNVELHIDLLDDMVMGQVEGVQPSVVEFEEIPSTDSDPGSRVGDEEREGDQHERPLGPDCRPLPVVRVEGYTDWVYIVKQGDNILELAKFFLNEVHSWPEIVARNPVLFGDLPQIGPPPIYPGQILILPGVASPLLYEVRLYDHLTLVGGRAYGNDYGSGRLWCTIYFQNSDRIGHDASIILRGQVLELYPLQLPENDGIWARSGDSFSAVVLSFSPFMANLNLACARQKEFGPRCDHIEPFDVVYPYMPASKTFIKVGPGQSLHGIVSLCYGKVTPAYLEAARIANRDVIGDDPHWLHSGQVIVLYGCNPSGD